MGSALISAISFLAAAAGSAAPAEFAFPRCPAPFAQLLSDHIFSAYAVQVPASRQRTHEPVVNSGMAHLFRTVIRDGAKDGPNFAGHFTVIKIGCGAGTTCLAIADTQTGKVYFPPEIKSAEALMVDTGKTDINALHYRRNSKLLIVVGMVNEMPNSAGMGYFLWRNGHFRLIHFTPAAKLCGLPASTQF